MTQQNTAQVPKVVQEYREAKTEFRWYKNELLEMVEDGEQGTDTWEEYRQEMKEVGQEIMSLARDLPDGALEGNVEVSENGDE